MKQHFTQLVDNLDHLATLVDSRSGQNIQRMKHLFTKQSLAKVLDYHSHSRSFLFLVNDLAYEATFTQQSLAEMLNRLATFIDIDPDERSSIIQQHSIWFSLPSGVSDIIHLFQILILTNIGPTERCGTCQGTIEANQQRTPSDRLVTVATKFEAV